MTNRQSELDVSNSHRRQRAVDGSHHHWAEARRPDPRSLYAPASSGVHCDPQEPERDQTLSISNWTFAPEWLSTLSPVLVSLWTSINDGKD
jgi:hypothetical protein